MKKPLRIETIFIFSIFLITCITAQDYYSNLNKQLFTFPKHTSLGGSALAFSRDGTPLSNPANIPLDPLSTISLAYSGYFENTFSTTLSSFITRFTKNLGVSMFAGYLFVPDIADNHNFDIDEVSGDPIYDPSNINYESSSEFFIHFGIGYAIISTKKMNIAIGGALHCLRRRLINWTGYGIGLDLGTTFELKKPGIRFSLLFDDITTNYIHWSSDYHDNSLPHARVGLGWRKEVPYIYGRLSFMYKSPDLFSNEGVGYNLASAKTGNISEPQEHNVKKDPSLLLTSGSYGLEYLIQKVVALRFGVDDTKRIFFGAGVNLFSQSLLFDFAYMVPYELPGTYSLSISYCW